MFIGADPNETREVEELGETWLVGTVPALRYATLRNDWTIAHRPVANAPESERDAVWHANREQVLAAAAALVRWGVRGVKGKAPLAVEKVKVGGTECDVIPAAMVDRMLRVAGGNLMYLLAGHVIGANDLDAETLLGFL